MRCRLRSLARRVHRCPVAVDDAFVKGVLHVRRRVVGAPEPDGIRLVLGEQQLVRAVAGEPVATLHLRVLGDQRGHGRVRLAVKARAPGPHVPGPRVPEPERGQEVQRRRLWAAVGGRDPDQDVVRVRLRVLDHDVEVAALAEDARVEQLELGIPAAAAAVLLDEPGVRVFGLRVLVEPAHVGMGRRAVQVEVVLLDVLAVIALRARQAEVAFLQDRIVLVPQGEREAEALVVVRDAEDAVLAPAVDARARVVVGEEVPGVAVRRVVLAHRAPLPIGQVRAPAPPVGLAFLRVPKPLLFRRHRACPPWGSWTTLVRDAIRDRLRGVAGARITSRTRSRVAASAPRAAPCARGAGAT